MEKATSFDFQYISIYSYGGVLTLLFIIVVALWLFLDIKNHKLRVDKFKK